MGSVSAEYTVNAAAIINDFPFAQRGQQSLVSIQSIKGKIQKKEKKKYEHDASIPFVRNIPLAKQHRQ